MSKEEYKRNSSSFLHKGRIELNKNCEVCGKPKTRHTNIEAKECKGVLNNES